MRANPGFRVLALLACTLAASELGTYAGVRLNSPWVPSQAPAGAIIGILSTAVEPEGPVTFSLAAGEGARDNGLFQVAGDTLRTGVPLGGEATVTWTIRIKVEDDLGVTTEAVIGLQAAPAKFERRWEAYLAANPAVAAAVGGLDSTAQDYLWGYLHELEDTGRIGMPLPGNMPADQLAAGGPISILLTPTELTRIHAAKIAHSLWLDREERLPWRLRRYSEAELEGLFDRNRLFRSGSHFYSVVDHSPSEIFDYVLANNLIREDLEASFQACLNDFRSDFVHSSRRLGPDGSVIWQDPSTACTPTTALSWRPEHRGGKQRVSRLGCHSMTRIALAVLRSINIPGYEIKNTARNEWFRSGHSTAVWPALDKVMPHGDDIYTALLRTTPASVFLPSASYFDQHSETCANDGFCVANRFKAEAITAHPPQYVLRRVRDPLRYGYESVEAWIRGNFPGALIEEEITQMAEELRAIAGETWTLNASAAAGGEIQVSPGQANYLTGDQVLLRAIPRTGFAFSHWTGGEQLDTANPLALTMESNATREAVFVSLADPIEAWRFAQFGPEFGDPEVAGDLADPNLNGLANLLEYALGNDPLAFGFGARPTVAVEVEDGFPVLRWTRPEPAPAGITYHVGITNDLRTWTYDSDEAVEEVAIVANQAHVRVRIGFPVPEERSQFMALLVQREGEEE